MADGYAMVDPNKLMLLTPGIDRATGDYLDFGVPATVVANFLREQRVVPEKCDLNSILFLMTPAEDESKLNTLIAKLVQVQEPVGSRRAAGRGAADAVRRARERYAGYTLRQVCNEMHDFYRERNVKDLQRRSFRAESFPELAMSPKEAYETLVDNEVDYVPLGQMRGPHLGDAGADLPAGHRRGRAGRALGRARAADARLLPRLRGVVQPLPRLQLRSAGRVPGTRGRAHHASTPTSSASRPIRTKPGAPRHGRHPEEDERGAADVHRHGQHDGLGHHHAARQHGAGRRDLAAVVDRHRASGRWRSPTASRRPGCSTSAPAAWPPMPRTPTARTATSRCSSCTSCRWPSPTSPSRVRRSATLRPSSRGWRPRRCSAASASSRCCG